MHQNIPELCMQYEYAHSVKLNDRLCNKFIAKLTSMENHQCIQNILY